MMRDAALAPAVILFGEAMVAMVFLKKEERRQRKKGEWFCGERVSF